uniref:Uncharacterized protein n=1 Tax=Candidatus Methanogaster sp. ANME-2c ERB4 TaxID=2759911 RepID=A0A7G9Y9K5_9EURY|nr:hypothetical protein LIDEEMHE_00005 [Methanosarcinales archaeon ANME-2c ERB4]QNO44961.1 hypothetical protein JLEBHCKC_00005 [Methanosarcinales archaeon ANME-2c ERB4]QNO46266.1 hypothetical protein KKFKAJIP_00002 [Methanosarcinales archaeon ANME-2c ERB4]
MRLLISTAARHAKVARIPTTPGSLRTGVSAITTAMPDPLILVSTTDALARHPFRFELELFSGGTDGLGSVHNQYWHLRDAYRRVLREIDELCHRGREHHSTVRIDRVFE